jgi:DMSO/TMAO reductase YedYZ heme-binding membrane subunit
VIAVQCGYVGASATAAPQSFTKRFLGFGLRWIDPSASFDPHFVTDVGLLHLAIGMLAVWAMRDVGLRRAVAVTWVAFAVPHLLYHLIHTAGMDALAATTSLLSLATSALAGVLLMVGVPPQVERLEPSPLRKGRSASH